MYLADYGQVKIHLDCEASEILTHFNSIQGQITFFLLNYRVAFQDFQIHLQGTVNNGFEEIQFIPEEHDVSSSPFVYQFIRKSQPTQPEFCLQGKGRGPHEFKFNLQLNSHSYPSSFQSGAYSIQYKLVVSSTLENIVSVAAEKILNLKGFLNLSLDPRVNIPLTVTRKKCKSSLFSSRHVLTAILAVNQRGFLPGEILVFDLTCKNCVNVVTMQASLVQRIVYTKNKTSTKVTSVVLDHSELRCQDNNDHHQQQQGNGGGDEDRDIHSWSGGLIIPENLMPSFTPTKKSLEIIYVLQFSVETSGTQPALKGEIPIVIGSTRGTPLSLNRGQTRNLSYPPTSSSSIAGPSSLLRNSARHSASNENAISYHFNTNSDKEPSPAAVLPPAYSTLYLYSRCSSLETLPPTYEEALDGIRSFTDEPNQWDESTSVRPRRNSNVM